MTAGEQTREFIYVDDLVTAIMCALDAPLAIGRVVNVGGGQPIKLLDLVAKIESAMGSSGLVRLGEIPYRNGEIMDYQLDSSLARDLLGWEPVVDLDEGLRRTVADG